MTLNGLARPRWSSLGKSLLDVRRQPVAISTVEASNAPLSILEIIDPKIDVLSGVST
jgi:hypothetical protein